MANAHHSAAAAIKRSGEGDGGSAAEAEAGAGATSSSDSATDCKGGGLLPLLRRGGPCGRISRCVRVHTSRVGDAEANRRRGGAGLGRQNGAEAIVVVAVVAAEGGTVASSSGGDINMIV